jgi:tRNA 2-thiouridine synthesizing protein D
MTIDAQPSVTPTAHTLTPLLLITADPSHPLAALALRYASAYLASTINADAHAVADMNNAENHSAELKADSAALQVFFYADGAHTANRLRWQSADQFDITKEWQQLAERYQLRLPVCVSTALSRGISDVDNSQRHQLQGDNLAVGFDLVGLGELAMMLQTDCRLLQF